MSKRVKVTHEGKSIEGVLVTFKALQPEHWLEYELETGGLVRLKVVVTDVITTDEKTPTGDPLVVVKSALLVDFKEAGKTDAH